MNAATEQKIRILQAKLNKLPAMGASPAADARIAKRERMLRGQILILRGSQPTPEGA